MEISQEQTHPLSCVRRRLRQGELIRRFLE